MLIHSYFMGLVKVQVQKGDCYVACHGLKNDISRNGEVLGIDDIPKWRGYHSWKARGAFPFGGLQFRGTFKGSVL
jgi:hypothetical protein